MLTVRRLSQNPLLTPDERVHWQALAAFNGCPVQSGGITHLVFRATASPQVYFTKQMALSQIGHAASRDGLNFKDAHLLITPEYHWEQYGCEDPRITKLGNKFYIFYTALADYPHTANGIKIGVAITKDCRHLLAKHQVTRFNSKAMALFPQKINGRMMALLTVNTDQPPAKIALAAFNKEANIWSENYWRDWLDRLNDHVLPLSRSNQDQVELGAPPIKTAAGWLVIYSYIRNYTTGNPIFGIEAVLLDLDDPSQIIGRTQEPLMVPEQEYELYGRVPNVIFPSGALVVKNKLRIFYGAADTTCCAAEVDLEPLVDLLKYSQLTQISFNQAEKVRLEKYAGNPIIAPDPKHPWENKYTFNPAAIWVDGRVHLLYRAMGDDETSVLGYATSQNGQKIDTRLGKPAYQPRADFEKKAKPGYSGCEDPRLTLLGNQIFMCYTAFDGVNPTRAVLTAIKKTDFLAQKWRWAKPVTISCPKRSDKNACLLPAKIHHHYALFHRIGGCIWIDYVNDLIFTDDDWVGGQMIAWPQPGHWDSEKVGIAAPPLATKDGWLLIYHGLSAQDNRYRLGALLLNREEPDQVIGKLPYPILEPTEKYERQGLRPGTVFACGAVIIKEKLFVYYGAADQYTAVASIALEPLLVALHTHHL
ncbi:hypothetical protein COU97_00525 [Candidatus Shapirobacteria bacterium CG10_big_fil_rev_8_21_14_0_10_48_15]|uniref:Glycosidase n=1 Tax=Candidatus Shapirobacteria bacterium CG10_big_fil_rev_8_21_14_0_10_48_15 TaxID=1974484 RepID=A0A2M8L7Q0_9BACT|nr:MAG: hypothetical protein COU97_00525 [Candidatus Shapirobacteria bacterium CG10_big_fil_rev_8_21_14_0_10_48_15]